MYSACIFCASQLGANEVVEHFPVGRRLAFDPAKGRLWVVCPHCARWNLSPLEERWEAVEECERLFRATPLRASSANVGLARTAEGTELVRIGAPLRPELAAWRYGEQFGGRRQRGWWGVGTVAGAAATAAAAVALGPAAILGGLPLLAWTEIRRHRLPGGPSWEEASRLLTKLRDDEGRAVFPRHHLVYSARLRSGAELAGGWALEVTTLPTAARLLVSEHPPAAERSLHRQVLRGHAASRAASVFLAHANRGGASPRGVTDSVARLTRAGTPERYITLAEQEARRMGEGYHQLWDMPHSIRLALEMALHETAERRALEGELAQLEEQWRDAEQIAALADRLAAAPEVEADLNRMRRGR